MSGGHGIDICRCGAVIAQCRCPGPHVPRVVVEHCKSCTPQPRPLSTLDLRIPGLLR